LNKLAQYYTTQKNFEPLPKYPAIEADVSIIVDKKIAWKDIRNLVLNSSSSLISSVLLLDVFENDKMEAGKKSVTFRITYQSPEKTLQMDEVDKIQEKVRLNLIKGVGAGVK
jgi:phenylalanyl-tRNA synthetase beta chain